MPITTRIQLTTVISSQQRQQDLAQTRLAAAHAQGKHEERAALKCDRCRQKAR